MKTKVAKVKTVEPINREIIKDIAASGLGPSVLDIAAQNRKMFLSTNDEFYSTFGISLAKFTHNVLGFDVLNFDDFITSRNEVGENESCSDVVKRVYGERAFEIIKMLLDFNP